MNLDGEGGARHPLDNPLWSALSTSHRALARGAARVLRYPPEVAPFLAIRGADDPDGAEAPDAAAGRAGAHDAAVAAELAAVVAPGEQVLLLGPPPVVPPGWQLDDLGPILQMVCDCEGGDRMPEPDGPPIALLDERARPAVLELTALVYPHYFRPLTTTLGRYFGIFERGRLAAMLGERMGMPGYRELSAICTHPDFLGRGLARRLMAYAANDLLARGARPFLHVSPANTRARELYERNHFRTRITIAFWSLRRPASPSAPVAGGYRVLR